MHYVVHDEAGVDTPVVAIGLLWYGVSGAAKQSPVMTIGALESLLVLIPNEAECGGGIFASLLTDEVVWDVGVKVGDCSVREVDGNAGPMCVIPV